jgi:hypothetical protein
MAGIAGPPSVIGNRHSLGFFTLHALSQPLVKKSLKGCKDAENFASA